MTLQQKELGPKTLTLLFFELLIFLLLDLVNFLTHLCGYRDQGGYLKQALIQRHDLRLEARTWVESERRGHPEAIFGCAIREVY